MQIWIGSCSIGAFVLIILSILNELKNKSRWCCIKFLGETGGIVSKFSKFKDGVRLYVFAEAANWFITLCNARSTGFGVFSRSLASIPPLFTRMESTILRACSRVKLAILQE